MKRVATAIILLSAMLGTAHAGMLSIDSSSEVSFSGYSGEPKKVTGPRKTGYTGTLSASSPGTLYVTYLGQESGFVDSFTLSGAGSLVESDALGITIYAPVSSGTIPFNFSDSRHASFSNGTAQSNTLGFAIFSENTVTQYGSFDYILGFNDSLVGRADYDDFVVGVKFVAAPVPEPETYGMILSGLGLIGFVAGRRKKRLI